MAKSTRMNLDAIIARKPDVDLARIDATTEATAIHVPLATLQNWEPNRTPMDPSARALMTILAREPDTQTKERGADFH